MIHWRQGPCAVCYTGGRDRALSHLLLACSAHAFRSNIRIAWLDGVCYTKDREKRAKEILADKLRPCRCIRVQVRQHALQRLEGSRLGYVCNPHVQSTQQLVTVCTQVAFSWGWECQEGWLGTIQRSMGPKPAEDVRFSRAEMDHSSCTQKEDKRRTACACALALALACCAGCRSQLLCRLLTSLLLPVYGTSRAVHALWCRVVHAVWYIHSHHSQHWFMSARKNIL